jgi:hypothetical protein
MNAELAPEFLSPVGVTSPVVSGKAYGTTINQISQIPDVKQPGEAATRGFNPSQLPPRFLTLSDGHFAPG